MIDRSKPGSPVFILKWSNLTTLNSGLYNCSHVPKNSSVDLYSEPPELELSKRFYPVPVSKEVYLSYRKTGIPDFKSLARNFYRNLSHIQNTTMLWAITYSLLHLSRKEALLKEHYRASSVNSFFYICQRLKSVKLLQWLAKR